MNAAMPALVVALGEAGAALHVGELADVEVAAVDLAPAEKDVGRALGGSLADHTHCPWLSIAMAISTRLT